MAGSTKSIGAAQAKLFLLGVLNPADIRQRIVETYEPDHRTLRQRVSIDAQIPRHFLGRQQADVFYFPLLIPIKGNLLDNLDVYGADGASLPQLSYREYLQVAARTLRDILASGFGPPHSFPLSDDALHAEYRALVGMIQRRLPGPAPTAPDPADPAGWEGIEELAATDADQRSQRDIAAAFARKLTSHYAIVVLVRPDRTGRFVIRYEQTLIPDMDLSRKRDMLTLALGTRPIKLTIDLGNASTCQSYHLRVAGTDGLYLGRQELSGCEATLRRTAPGAPTRPHIRFRKRLGQPHAHFYARFFPVPAPGESPLVRFSYYEVPPGSVVRAAVSVVACLLLVWTVGIIESVGGPDPGTDAPAFLLAFPAVAAAWLGFESPSRRLLEGTMASRASLAGTTFLSIAASALFMAHKALGDKVVWSDLPRHFTVLGATDMSWAVLILLALVNASAVCYCYVNRLFLFTRLAARNQRDR
ncbi:MAG TPA: hypothetical protein VFX70_15190 [Mycobacteriales bacterium]|nr:hypothetical protein [Mycobacteriales bacterium]